MIPAHGGTPGLIIEIAPLALLVVGAIVVWRRSRTDAAEGAGADDEARLFHGVSPVQSLISEI